MARAVRKEPSKNIAHIIIPVARRIILMGVLLCVGLSQFGRGQLAIPLDAF
jgi:hypothetical protein